MADNDNPELPELLLLLYVPGILLASIGPLLVIRAILGTPALRTVSNGFLINLATSDLLFVILACPTTLAQVFTGISQSMLETTPCVSFVRWLTDASTFQSTSIFQLLSSSTQCPPGPGPLSHFSAASPPPSHSSSPSPPPSPSASLHSTDIIFLWTTAR